MAVKIWVAFLLCFSCYCTSIHTTVHPFLLSATVSCYFRCASSATAHHFLLLHPSPVASDLLLLLPHAISCHRTCLLLLQLCFSCNSTPIHVTVHPLLLLHQSPVASPVLLLLLHTLSFYCTRLLLLEICFTCYLLHTHPCHSVHSLLLLHTFYMGWKYTDR